MRKLTKSDFEKVEDKFPSWDDWWKAKSASYLCEQKTPGKDKTK